MNTLAKSDIINDRPFVFIGSSTEGKAIAKLIQLNLQEACEALIWEQGLFTPGGYTLERLVSQLNKFDFAIFIFSPDDLIESRGQRTHSPRDNVLIELGLFIGRLGRTRTFVVHDATADIKIPSDLAGVTLLKFFPPGQGGLQAALGPACTEIERAVINDGVFPRPRFEPRLPPTPPDDPAARQEAVARLVEDNREKILGAQAGRPSLEVWYSQLWPVLHQAAYYTMPTYFLDRELNIIDWNVAFELIFEDIVPSLRYVHVNEFIAHLANVDEVFDHGRKFTTRAFAEKLLPMVDLERLVYRSNRFGDVEFLKVATQLHDSKGELRGWTVGLMVKDIEWPEFQKDLERRIRDDKLWSVYAASYDRVLNKFPPYAKLIEDVVSVIPEQASSVVDIGAGTGNTTSFLLDRGYRVTSIEFNAGMIEVMRGKGLDKTRHRVIKASAEQLNDLAIVEDESFEGAVMVNVLYGLDDPLACLHGVKRILKPGGYLGLSTTHADISLDPLLAAIKATLEAKGDYETLEADYGRLYDANKQIEQTIAKRVTPRKYLELVRNAGFDIIDVREFTYEGAVMLIHARKR